MRSYAVMIPDYEDAVVGGEDLGPAHRSYATRSVSMQRNAFRVLDIISEIEADGCYVGENHPLESELRSIIRGAEEALRMLLLRGSQARREGEADV